MPIGLPCGNSESQEDVSEEEGNIDPATAHRTVPCSHRREHLMDRRRYVSLATLVVLVVTLIAPVASRASGVIVVEPPPCDPGCPEPFPVGEQLEIRSHRVD